MRKTNWPWLKFPVLNQLMHTENSTKRNPKTGACVQRMENQPHRSTFSLLNPPDIWLRQFVTCPRVAVPGWWWAQRWFRRSARRSETALHSWSFWFHVKSFGNSSFLLKEKDKRPISIHSAISALKPEELRRSIHRGIAEVVTHSWIWMQIAQ